MANMTVFDVIDRLRAAWRFKTDPVPEEAIRRILEAAMKAASGATFSALGIGVHALTEEPRRHVRRIAGDQRAAVAPGSAVSALNV